MLTPMNRSCTYIYARSLNGNGWAAEGGFALFTTLIIVIIVGILAVSSQRSTELTEVLAGNSIQRSRAFHAAEGGLIEAETSTAGMAAKRVFSSPSAAQGVFSRNTVASEWWRSEDFTGAHVIAETQYPGVVDPPEFVVEEIGNYESDGGSGIVSLDRGGGGYGRLTASGREVVLYRLQSKGVGSTSAAQALVESLVIQSQ